MSFPTLFNIDRLTNINFIINFISYTIDTCHIITFLVRVKGLEPSKCGGRSSVPYPLGYTRLFIKDNLFNKTTEPSPYSPILLIYSDTGKMKLSMKERPTYFSPWVKTLRTRTGLTTRTFHQSFSIKII